MFQLLVGNRKFQVIYWFFPNFIYGLLESFGRGSPLSTEEYTRLPRSEAPIRCFKMLKGETISDISTLFLKQCLI